MPSNEIMSVAGQLCGIPLAGPESFSQQQLDYLKRALGVDETVLWEGSISFNVTVSESVYNFKKLKLKLAGTKQVFEVELSNSSSFNLAGAYISNDPAVYTFGALWTVSNDGLTLSASGKGVGSVKTGSIDSFFNNNASNGGLIAVVGVGRIAGGN